MAKIPRKRLGNSDLEVPMLCLGTMTWVGALTSYRQ